jgi:hypothetical protein
MLETNGTLVGALTRALPWLAYVSMDIKLPSVDGEHVGPATQRRFLSAAVASGVVTWAKVVVGPSIDPEEFDRAVAMVASVADEDAVTPAQMPELFLQPVTPFAGVSAAPTPDQVLELHERALRRYPRVRVIPQTHKAIGQL